MGMVGNGREQESDIDASLISTLAHSIACEIVAGLEQGDRVPTREACERVLMDVRSRIDAVLGAVGAEGNGSGQLAAVAPEREGSMSVVVSSQFAHSLRRILVVAKDSSVRASLVRMLERDEYVVESSDDIQDATVMRDMIPDLVLLSVGSPSVMVRQACLRARETAAPIVLLGPDGDDAAIAAFNAGADDYMRLSMPTREFLARVEATLRRGMALRHAQHMIAPRITSVRTGALMIDVGRGAVTHDGQSIALTPVESRVLTFLTRRIGRMVPTAEIVEDVWGSARSAGNPLWITMSRLRRKIEPDPAHPIYLTKGARGAYSLAQIPAGDEL